MVLQITDTRTQPHGGEPRPVNGSSNKVESGPSKPVPFGGENKRIPIFNGRWQTMNCASSSPTQRREAVKERLWVSIGRDIDELHHHHQDTVPSSVHPPGAIKPSHPINYQLAHLTLDYPLLNSSQVTHREQRSLCLCLPPSWSD